jgi:pilus assembly protein CpaB
VVVRAAFFILMALALMGFGTVAWVSLRPPPPAPVAAAPGAPAAPAPPVQKKVLVAARTIASGDMLKPEDLVGKLVATENDPGVMSADSPDALRTLTGSMAKHVIAAGVPVREEDVMKPTDHGFMAAALRPGMRAVTIGVDATSGSAGLVWPGDRVDLILTQTLTDPSLPPGRRISSETILTNARVIAIDQQLMQGAAPSASGNRDRTVTLEVNPEEVQRVSVAMRLGHLSLSVRAVSNDDDSHGAATDTAAAGRTGSVFARDVSAALSGEAPEKPQQRVIHIFTGSGDTKEFKY